jgi:hypothetical protein
VVGANRRRPTALVNLEFLERTRRHQPAVDLATSSVDPSRWSSHAERRIGVAPAVRKQKLRGLAGTGARVLLLRDSSSAGLVTLSMIGAALGARSAPAADYCFDQRVSQESAST